MIVIRLNIQYPLSGSDLAVDTARSTVITISTSTSGHWLGSRNHPTMTASRASRSYKSKYAPQLEATTENKLLDCVSVIENRYCTWSPKKLSCSTPNILYHTSAAVWSRPTKQGQSEVRDARYPPPLHSTAPPPGYIYIVGALTTRLIWNPNISLFKAVDYWISGNINPLDVPVNSQYCLGCKAITHLGTLALALIQGAPCRKLRPLFLNLSNLSRFHETVNVLVYSAHWGWLSSWANMGRSSLTRGCIGFRGSTGHNGPFQIIVVSSLYVTLDQVVLTPYLASHVTSVMEQTHLPR